MFWKVKVLGNPMNPIEKVPRCACRNLAARRNCWGSNKLWDETRSRRPLMKNLFLPLLIQFCNSDVSSHPMIHLSCVCRCRNSGVSCSTGTLFNPETCRWLKTIVSKSRSRERRNHFFGTWVRWLHTVVTHSVTAPVVETSFRAIEDAYLNDTLLLLLGKVSKNRFF